MANSAKNTQGASKNNWFAVFAAFLCGAVLCFDAQAVTINVVSPDGVPLPVGYRWLVEEDTTHDVQPGIKPGPFDPKTLSLRFHTSYAPVVSKGTSANNVVENLDPSKRYFVSVLPDSGYTMSGAPIAAGQAEVTVTVNPTPIPTAQISVFVYNDNEPINNIPDAAELARGLGDFTIILTEAGGRYGHNGGQVSQDAFGNPLGTTYNPDGSPDVIGTGVIKTGANGVVRIKNLAPGKYGVTAVPPAGADWHQTHTIEGTRTIDAWVKANEPPFFVEFGPPGHHAFIGFVSTINDASVLDGSRTVSGRIVNLHTARPPDFAFFDGHPVPNCWVGLNELPAIGGRGVYTQPCNPDSTFSIPNVPPGDYQLVVWDDYQDTIFAMHNFTVGATDVDLQDVAVFNWFNRLESSVFFDANGNGFRDDGEVGIPEQAVNLRFRDGSIYQSFPTDTVGYVPFDEVFPFFHWLIAEVDFLRFKATGATVIVDAGGEVPADAGAALPSRDKLNPQPQFETDPFTGEVTTTPLIGPAGNNLSRTETGPVLTQAFQGFLGQTNVIEWGKGLYANGENGGISGIVYYAVTRAENDPRYAAAETWEPGIPRVQVNLYQDFTGPLGRPDGVIDDLNGNGITLADVDNYPFDNFPGPEDIDHNGNFSFDQGDAVQVVHTDSFDDAPPTGCQGEQFISNGVVTDCFDGLRNFNQMRPGVFDGGYAFNGIPAGTYIVEAITPPGYELLKEEDKNVDFGDSYFPSPLALPQPCVGDPHLVPAELSLMPGVPSFYAGQSRPLCDRKQVLLANRQNAAADFFMFTEVPVAAHVVGFVLDDLSNEFDFNSPQFGEKHAPPFLPVSFRDYTGREITRVYTDEYGKYNALLPSTYSVNIPTPSGVSANMLTACINSPTKPDPFDPTRVVTDPFFNRQYSQFCYTFQYMPGTTTYLDTPVVPIAAFAGPGQFPLDCEMTDGTPIIYTASRLNGNGPWVPTPPANINNQPRVDIVSSGVIEVPNPAYDGTTFTEPTTFRDYGFGGTPGTVTLTQANGVVVNLPVVSWSDGVVRVRVPRFSQGTQIIQTGQLALTRGDNGKSTKTGVTLSVAGPAPIPVAPNGSIQAAIDAAPQGSLIMVPPGRYEELLVMHKRVRLQGWGAPAVTINAVKAPAEKLQAWRNEIDSLFAANQFTLLPGQALGFDIPNNEPMLFNTEEGAGITVVANPGEFNAALNNLNGRARIDGFTITGADHGGAIFVNGYANNLVISNNRLVGNAGTFGGGIRVGNPFLVGDAGPVDNQNDNANIHHNHIAQNGGLGGAGGGVSLATGADNYRVTENHICGNFTTGNGGGVGHIGRSNNGLIQDNDIIFNQTFNQMIGVSGGGIAIAGLPSVAAGGLTAGSGTVRIDSNLIQGNLAGAGDGGGIRLQFVNGQDIARRPNAPAQWFTVDVLNNMIVNNVAGLAGGGISLQDVARSNIIHNTIANNDSTATAGAAFAPGSPNESTPQPAGIVSRAHSTLLSNTIGNGPAVQSLKEFANPTLLNNIVWHNRSFYFTIDTTVLPSFYTLLPDVNAGDAPVYADLAVLGTATPRLLNPRFSLLTDITPYPGANNLAADPAFVAEYTNGDTSQVVIREVTTGLAVQPAFDEGGNFIDVRFGPLTLVDPGTGLLFGDYHLQAGSPALVRGNFNNTSQFPLLIRDFDRQIRSIPLGSRPDIGADER